MIINEIENTRKKISETTGWFFEKIHKIDVPLERLIKKRRSQKLPPSGIKKKNRKKDITTDTVNIKRIIREC